MKYANLHLHSRYSDGVYTPRELCEKGKELGYGAITVSDHDCIAGYKEIVKACKDLNLEHIIGWETGACIEDKAFLHFTAYDFDPNDKNINEYLILAQRDHEISTKLKFEGLIKRGAVQGITWQNVLDDAPNGAWLCNEHIFYSMCKRAGYNESYYWTFMHAFWQTPIEYERVFREWQAKDFIKMILDAGGVPVLAHPHVITEFFPCLLEMGIKGIECSHPDIDKKDEREAREFCEKHRLYITGGTDHTGRLANHPDKRGENPTKSKDTNHYCAMLTLLDTDVRNGVSKEEFDMLKNRIYG